MLSYWVNAAGSYSSELPAFHWLVVLLSVLGYVSSMLKSTGYVLSLHKTDVLVGIFHVTAAFKPIFPSCLQAKKCLHATLSKLIKNKFLV